VIEDDYDAEFRYDRQAVAALQGLAPNRVAYLGSASKLLAPGMRTGWAIAPDWLRPALATEKAYDDYGSATIEQEVLAELIADGTLGRHVRRARLAYRRRRDAALRAVSRHFPHWQIRGVAAGLQLLVTPPHPVDDRAIVRRAWRSGIRVGALTTFRDADRPMTGGDTGLVIGFAMVPEPAIEASIEALAAIAAPDVERASA
jgi:GntR family transcriptional regulator/MocR family aminotransferase